MRLLWLSDSTKLSLTKHDPDKLPPYAILSHTWGADDEEVSFDDVVQGAGQDKSGYAKILFCGRQALEDDLKDFWVDTCCIDKNSSAELNEAIISMFRWYKKATKCYVYLSDVSTGKHDRDGEPCDWKGAFQKSRWFTRGWTLQELLAPRIVEFWSRDGHRLGTRESLKDLIYEITGIPTQALIGAPLSGFSTLERRRWASGRDTKKKEDKAYCLIGIFDVSIPILYGEGEDKALERLSEAVKRSQKTSDNTVAFTLDGENSETTEQDPRKKLLDSLKFKQFDVRHSTIKDAQRTTCEWLLHHADYIAWNNKDRHSNDREILWIAGKPGAGKSTLMKFTLAHIRNERKQNEIVLDFFFNARGDFLEKTTLGLYRALLYQLLRQVTDLQLVLDDIGDDGFHESSASIWTLSRLQNLFRDAVRNLGPRKLIVFVDALDECNEEQVRDMVEFFEDLGEHDLSDESRLSICFASRHYPSIEIQRGWRLILEGESGHADDLRKYIHRQLPNKKNDKKVDEIQTLVQTKANGVFIWVVLVVRILSEDFRRGRIFAVEKRLLEIPTKLSDLFKELLQRDHVNMDDLLLCLQWILFAKRPLSREEFYQAMESGLHGHGGQWRPKPWDPAYVTVDDMESFVLHSSKGLAELTKSKTAPTVQFIHESVRDFLVKDGGLEELWPELSGDLAKLSHSKLCECCSHYLAADVSGFMNPWEPQRAFSIEGTSMRKRVTAQFPFLEYAKEGFFHHANEAARDDTQEPVPRSLALDTWIYASNLLALRDYQRYSDQVSLLYVLADRGFSHLIRAIRSPDTWLRLPGESHQYPVLAAFANGHRDALLALLGEKGIGSLDKLVEDPGFNKPDRECSRWQDPLQWAIENTNWALSDFLLSEHADNDFFSVSKIMKRRDRLLAVVESGAPSTVIRMLLVKNKDVNAHGENYSKELLAASRKGHHKVVQVLVDAGADVNADAGYHGSALAAASCGGYEKVVQVLIGAGADVNAQGGLYGSALQQAASRGPQHKEVVQMLIDAGADVNAAGGLYGSALQAAASQGPQNEEVMQMLIDAGADVNAPGGALR